MFARLVRMNVKPGDTAEFSRILENNILPLLRNQRGFRDEIALVAPSGKEAVAISLWDEKEHAETYTRTTYPEVLKALQKVLDGTPQVQTYEVSNSTFHKIAGRVAA